MVRRRRGSKTSPPSSRVQEQYLSLKECSEIVRVPVSTLRTWTLQGLIPRIKMPGIRGRVLVKLSDLIAAMERYWEPAREEILDELHKAENRPLIRRDRPSRPRKGPAKDAGSSGTSS